MDVLLNTMSTKNLDETYFVKQCNCGSSLRITNGDVISLVPDKHGVISICCPCCGESFEIYKYFGGKKYSLNQYSEVSNAFFYEISTIIDELTNILYGYGEYYFSLSKIVIKAEPIRVCIEAYVDRYEFENWDKRIAVDSFENKFELFLTDKIEEFSLIEYAKYSQALSEFIRKTISNHYELKRVLNVQLDLKILTMYFRCGGSNCYEFFDIKKHHQLKEKNRQMRQTIYTPEIKDGLNFVGNKIEDASINIQNGLLAISGSIHNSSIRQIESRQNIDVSMHGYLH